MNSIEKQILLGLSPAMQKVFGEMQRAWRLMVESEAALDAAPHMNGSRGALYEQATLETLFKARLDSLKDYAGGLGRNNLQPPPGT